MRKKESCNWSLFANNAVPRKLSLNNPNWENYNAKRRQPITTATDDCNSSMRVGNYIR